MSALEAGRSYHKGKPVTEFVSMLVVHEPLSPAFPPLFSDHILLEGKSGWGSKESMGCPNGPAISGGAGQRKSLTIVAKGIGSLGFAADRLEIWWQGSCWLCVLLRR